MQDSLHVNKEQYHGAVLLDVQLPLRLDCYIAQTLKLMSRSQIKRRNLKAVVNAKEVKLSFLVKTGDELALAWDEDPPCDLMPEDIPLNIIYEDEKVVVVNKAQGIVVHPAAGNWSGTLANALLWHFHQSASHTGPPASIRPFIVHRLDKDTSGVIIAAADIGTLNFLQNEFKSRRVRKTYIAITQGVPKEERGLIANYITRDKKTRTSFTVSDTTGKFSVTGFRVLKSFSVGGSEYAFIRLQPKTGRTHQIRVHLKYLGCPILGDAIYGKKDKNFPDAALMLHARRLGITLPGNATQSVFSAGLPARFKGVLAACGRGRGTLLAFL
ncbi:MAG: RluA family pseudouridine synthase [Spirochaetaceae bacterium]|nr:RluA family pseudouridine synthase [Spirochaetaceae bacterium]